MSEYFTLGELRAFPDVSSAVTYPDARVNAAEAYVVGILEREVGTSFIARTVTDERHNGGDYTIALKKPWVLSVTSATENGVTVTDTLRVQDGVLQRINGTSLVPWAAGYGNVLVTYQAGYTSTVPGDVKEQVLKATRAHLLATGANSIANDRRTSRSTDIGTDQFVVAGGDRPSGYPEFDALIAGYKHLNTFGFA